MANLRREYERTFMKIIVIGGSGLIGSRLVNKLGAGGHQVVAASPKTGVNTLTGEGLAEAVSGAEVVVDVTNAPSWEDDAVLKFFTTSTRNILAAEADAGVGHHVALSVVGTDRLQESGYFRAKLAQERLIVDSGVPYTLVRATQFFEFIGAIAQSSADGDVIRLTSALMQPMSADDVAGCLADYTVGPALNGMVEIAGPEALGIDEAAKRVLVANGDTRRVVTDDNAVYYGLRLNDRSLTPGKGARLAPTRLSEWLSRTAKAEAVVG